MCLAEHIILCLVLVSVKFLENKTIAKISEFTVSGLRLLEPVLLNCKYPACSNEFQIFFYINDISS